MKKIIESEKVLERKLVDRVKKAGGATIKLTSQYHRGDPDRQVLLQGGISTFAEMKSTGKKPTKMQELRHKQLRDLGFEVYVIDSTELLNEFFKRYGI